MVWLSSVPCLGCTGILFCHLLTSLHRQIFPSDGRQRTARRRYVLSSDGVPEFQVQYIAFNVTFLLAIFTQKAREVFRSNVSHQREWFSFQGEVLWLK